MTFFYDFPKIETIDDVLPHIDGRDEFIVAEREFGTIINYAVAFADTFAMIDENDLGGKIRRECRGLVFFPDGRIMSRPFHKFFNLGEREETQIHNIDFSKLHRIVTKLDGSMLRPIIHNGSIRWGTKMGFSEVAEMAEKFVAKSDIDYNSFAQKCVEQNLTPIFEYVGPNNKIVINYEMENMILLAVRHNITGEYLDIWGQK